MKNAQTMNTNHGETENPKTLDEAITFALAVGALWEIKERLYEQIKICLLENGVEAVKNDESINSFIQRVTRRDK